MWKVKFGLEKKEEMGRKGKGERGEEKRRKKRIERVNVERREEGENTNDSAKVRRRSSFNRGEKRGTRRTLSTRGSQSLKDLLVSGSREGYVKLVKREILVWIMEPDHFQQIIHNLIKGWTFVWILCPGLFNKSGIVVPAIIRYTWSYPFIDCIFHLVLEWII